MIEQPHGSLLSAGAKPQWERWGEGILRFSFITSCATLIRSVINKIICDLSMSLSHLMSLSSYFFSPVQLRKGSDRVALVGSWLPAEVHPSQSECFYKAS